jgi:tRNA-2-methylthio-N6-dimethylallyladenosine synthase
LEIEMEETSRLEPEHTAAPAAPKRVFIHTFGCQMNELDSDKMYALLARQGYAKALDAESADVVLVNTCSIREKAEHKLYSLLGRFRERGDGVVIGVTGCVAQQEGETLLKKFPYVDLVMGPDAIPRVGELVERARRAAVVDIDVFDGQEYPFVDDLPLELSNPVSAFVTIQKGCDNKCTFCIVPATRGIERSRSADDIVLEVRALAARGVREVTLLGQNVNSYGRKSGEISFAQLLKRINDEAEDIRRIRFTTSHPRDLGPDLIEAYATLPRLSPYIHLPVQSGSNRVLKRMKRYYKVEEYLEKVGALRQAVPDLAITTDFIVGFPGETLEDFEATLRLLEEVRFDASFSFLYSPRPDTPALKLGDDVPLEEKKRRLALLQDIQRRISLERNQALEGHITEVLVEGPSRHDPDELTGRTPGNKTVNFPGRSRLIGQEIAVKVTRAGINSLRGELVLQ